MSYVDVGEGPVVVMLHGNPSWSFYYRRLASLLQADYRVIVPDHIGCGLSSKPQNYEYRLDTHINNLELLMKHLHVEDISLVLHDWGGAIGMGYATRNPNNIQSITVFNTAAFRSTRIPFRIRICRTPILGDLIIRGLNGFARAALYMAVSKKMSSEINQCYLFPYDSWNNRIATLRFVQDIPLSYNDPSYDTLIAIENKLHLFQKTPMLICWGGKDFCFNDHFFEEWKIRFPNAESHHFPQAAHYVLEDAFEQIGPIVKDFLSRNSV
jgi:haloalkane dehalogenase